ncbi:coiled-coil domain-containing protein 174 [Diachasmimorpha longicaudata]|uniref:coiled-coil domain-containing protein 174 n=1 Tax=Diachasmimorpha longicaudata TaxID=58733 RepID=UPI0030B8703C
MNNSKKINVSYSSLVGLKAELLRKHAEVQEAKAKNKIQSPMIVKSTLKAKTSKNVKKSSKPKEPKVTEIEDINDLKKSRYMLEAKSRLYDKLRKNHGDECDNYLVDFSNKPASSASSSDDEIYKEEDYEDRNSDPEDDWVEYSDCFGRTRKCLRRDLPKMQEKDEMIKQEISKEPPQDTEAPPNPPPFIVPQKEPEIEKLRKKWEEQSEKLSHKPDIHYQDILFDEARAHGVGYYAFSQNEDERLKQQENLSKLRKETELRQKEAQNLKDLKAQMEKNRLKSARIRQRIRAGLPAEPEEEEEALQSTLQPSAMPEPTETPEKPSTIDETNEEHSLCVIEDKIKAFGELLGKRPKFRELSQEEWIHKRRKDRMGEFAPVYDNFKPGGFLNGTRDNQIVVADHDEDPVRIKSGGPEPTDMWESQGPLESSQDIANSEEKSNSEDPEMLGPVPPLNFITGESSSLINSRIPPFTCGNPISNSSNNDPPLPIIPPLEVLRVPPPTFQYTFNSCNVGASSAPWNSGSTVEDAEESDDSEIIGPLPPSDLKDGMDLATIPLPDEIPSPSPSLPTLPTNLNVDKISEGLKFLRKKFDDDEKR